MPKQTFRGVIVRGCQFGGSSKGTVNIDFSADMTTPVCRAMGWGVDGQPFPAPGETSGKLAGEILAKSCELVPNGLLKDQTLDLANVMISKFEYSVTRAVEGKPGVITLFFSGRTAQKGAAGAVEEYFGNVGDAVGALKIEYDSQETLPGLEEGET